MPSNLTYDILHRATTGGVAAIRSRSRLQPAGGPGDKVFPPTYATGDKNLRYAVEQRRIDGRDVQCVLLDSVASQANRLEEALQRAWEESNLPFPVVAIDFRSSNDVADLDRISTLQAPHRIFDALLRDSVEGSTLFRDTPLGKAITDATWKNATSLYQVCPTALVFGAWDSTGPKGGLGTKFQRALVSEIVAIGAVTGSKTASRLDPTGIQANVAVFHHKDNPADYTIDPAEAQKTNGKPIPFSRSGAEGKGKPSSVNHSNVAPTIDTFAGGITFDYAVQTTVLSLPALRRLRFQTTVDGTRLDGEPRIKAEQAARTALAALALVAVTGLRESGFDLRSRCTLVPEAPFALDLLPAESGEPQVYNLTAAEARTLLAEAHSRANELGFGWTREPIKLQPAPKLAALIAKSRELAAAGADQDGVA